MIPSTTAISSGCDTSLKEKADVIVKSKSLKEVEQNDTATAPEKCDGAAGKANDEKVKVHTDMSDASVTPPKEKESVVLLPENRVDDRKVENDHDNNDDDDDEEEEEEDNDYEDDGEDDNEDGEIAEDASTSSEDSVDLRVSKKAKT